MPPEKFKIANAVVKAESTLLSLLESTSNLSYEEKTKVVDRIHVQKKKKEKERNILEYKQRKFIENMIIDSAAVFPVFDLFYGLKGSSSREE